MFCKSQLPFQWLPCCALLLSTLFVVAPPTRASACPTDANAIAADRPDVTNSSSVVPFGSLQVENGVDWSVRYGSNALDGTTTRLRLGVARCTEFLIDVPSYLYSLNGPEPSGFSDGVVSVKRQLPAPLGFDLSATAGLGFPSGSQKISGRGYQPYIQFPWSRELGDDWSLAGMFTVTWFRSDSARNTTLEPTLSLERVFGPAADVFVEYVGDYDHQRPRQQLDGGGAWRFTKNQQLDFHVGFGLNRASVDHFFGIGYSFRLDGFLLTGIQAQPR
jgi:outer membrane putative beta-barrel porin/alpha-amylase